MDDATALSNLVLFRHVPLAELQELCVLAPPTSFAPGAEVFRCGQAADVALLLVEGMLSASVDAGGKQQVVGTVRPGEVVGEQGLFIEQGERNATVTAVEPSRCLILTSDLLDTAASNQALIAIENHMLQTLAERIRHTNRVVQKAWLQVLEDTMHGRKGPSLRDRLLSFFGGGS